MLSGVETDSERGRYRLKATQQAAWSWVQSPSAWLFLIFFPVASGTGGQKQGAVWEAGRHLRRGLHPGFPGCSGILELVREKRPQQRERREQRRAAGGPGQLQGAEREGASLGAAVSVGPEVQGGV